MNKNTRRRITLSVALVAGLILLGYWIMRADDVADAPQAIEATLPAESQPEPIAEPVSPDDESSKSAFVTLRGRVIDAVTREPVREFEVQLLRPGSTPAGEEAQDARNFRNRDGRFEWPYVPAGEWTVGASAAGYQRLKLANVRLDSEATQEIVLPLRPAPGLRGRVFDEESGAPIGNADIMLSPTRVSGTENDHGWRGTSADDGGFLLENVPPGRMRLHVSAEHHVARNLDVDVGEDTPPLQIGLIAGGSITGRLVGSDGAMPVSGMIWLFNQQGGEGRSTGPRGEFDFHSLAPGRYQLEGRTESGVATREIVLARNQRIDGVVLALTPGHNIRGIVTGLRPDELGHVQLSVSRDGEATDFPDVWIDDRGAFLVRGVTPGLVYLSANGKRRQLSKTIQMPADSDVSVTLDFPRGVRLSGRITRGGEPLSNVRVMPEPQPQPGEQPIVRVHQTSTSPEGTYVIEDLPPGKYFLRVARHRSTPFEVSADTVFHYDMPPGQLSGRVLAAQDQLPIAGAEVFIWPAEPVERQRPVTHYSDVSGKFEIDGLEPGELLLTVYKPEYEMLRKRISFDAHSKELTIELREEKGVEVTAHEAGSDRPPQILVAIEVIGPGRGSLLNLPLDDDGKAYLPRALAGSTLKFLADDCEPTVVENWNGSSLDLQCERAGAR